MLGLTLMCSLARFFLIKELSIESNNRVIGDFKGFWIKGIGDNSLLFFLEI